MSLFTDLKNVLTPYAQRIKGLAEVTDELKADLEDVENKTLNAFAVESASGAIASFTDGADDIPLKSLVIDINPVQAGTGDPSPENVRPITGCTGCNVRRTGKNLFDYDESKVSACETSTGAIRSYYPTGITNCTITFSAYLVDGSSVTSAFVNIGKLVNGKITVVGTFLTTTGDITNSTVTFAEGEEAVLVSAVSETIGIVYNLPNYNIQIELGSTPTDYEPYAGQSYPISWETEAGTVYGGMLDILTGVLTVDMAMKVFNGTDNDGLWSRTESNNRIRCYVGLPGAKSGSTRLRGNFISADLTNHGGYPAINKAAINTTPSLIIGVSSDITSVDDWKTYLANNNLQVVYELATPQTYQLTPQEVSSLLGINNIWADTGNTNVEYRADTVLYADKLTKRQSSMIAPVETSYTATRNYTTGQLLIVNNTLYKVTANIANGGTITPNTNVLATTLSEVIASLS